MCQQSEVRLAKSSRPTMHDVAAAAGVSQMTVSRVFRGDGYISQDTKSRVLEAARGLGYIHNRLASVQRGVKNPMVAVVLPTLKNNVFTDVLAGITDTLSGLGMRPVFGVSEYAQQAEEDLVRDMLSWQPTGLILSGVDHTAALREMVVGAKCRVAEIMDADGAPISASFGVSHEAIGAEMARHFLDRGLMKVALIASHGGQDGRAAKRMASFRDTLEKGGGEIVYDRVAKEPSSMVLGRSMMQHCLREVAQCDAVYCANDDLAAGGLMHCLVEGLSVPKDIAIAGFNDLPFVSALPLRITTTRTPRYDMGARAAEFVAGQGSEQLGPVRSAAQLVIGDTT